MPAAAQPLARAAATHPWPAHVLVSGLWLSAVLVSQTLSLPTVGIRAALAVHLLGLLLALGAIVLIDWYALVWLSGLRPFRDITRLSEAAHPIIWLGTGLLLISGALLHPDLSSALTWTKLILVLVIVNNGVTLRALGPRLMRLGSPRSLSEVPRRLRIPMLTLFALSQISWWAATIIGYLTTTWRHGP